MRCKPRVINPTLFLSLVAFVLWVHPVAAHNNRGYSYSHAACTSNPDWMSTLPDSLHLSGLSVPGTHESLSILEHSISAHCQMMELHTQLAAGIRAIDIRLKTEGSQLRLWHNKVVIWAYFDDVLNASIQFLKDHDQETILMRVVCASGDYANFSRIFKTRYMDAAYEDTTYWEGWFWHPEESAEPTNPTLREMRGKIVLMQDFPDTTQYGLDYRGSECCDCTDFPKTNCDSDATIKIQDAYSMGGLWSMGWKWQSIKRHLQRAAAEDPPKSIYINYLVGSSSGIYPYTVASGHWTWLNNDHFVCGFCSWAEHLFRSGCWPFYCYYYNGMNELTYNYIMGHHDQRTGIIMADFPGGGLIDHIIAVNDSLYQLSAPVAVAGGPYKAIEGCTVVLDAGGSSDPYGSPLAYRWDVDSDGIWETDWGISPTAEYTWYDNYCSHDSTAYPPGHEDTVCVAIVEVRNESYTSIDVADVIVMNAAPAALITDVISPVVGCILPGQEVAFVASFEDPGCLDDHAGKWDFGDGSVIAGTMGEGIECPDTVGVISDVHTFSLSGMFPVVLEVEDSDGGLGRDTTWVKIMTAAEAVDFADLVIQELPESCFKGQAAQRKNALSEKLGAVKDSLEAGGVLSAMEQLANDIRAKADGLDNADDWVVEEEAQRTLCLMLDELLEFLQSTLAERVDAQELVGASMSREPVMEYGLFQNQPNPFARTTTITLVLPEPSPYELLICDIAGRVVRRYSASSASGKISIVWDGRDQSGVPLSSGIYFYRVGGAGFTETRKMVLIR